MTHDCLTSANRTGSKKGIIGIVGLPSQIAHSSRGAVGPFDRRVRQQPQRGDQQRGKRHRPQDDTREDGAAGGNLALPILEQAVAGAPDRLQRGADEAFLQLVPAVGQR